MVSGTLPRRSGTSKTILHRTAFTTSRALEFFNEKELAMQLGFAANFWPIALLKELLVAYLLTADIVSGPLPMRLREVNQPVIITRNRCSRPRPRLLTCI